MADTAVSQPATPWEALNDDLLSCSICFERFKNPKVLPCLHTFCQDCIHRHFEIFRLSNGGRVSCPTCRELIPLPVRGIPGFRNDITVARTKDLLHDILGDFQESDFDTYGGACGVDRAQNEQLKREMRNWANSLQGILAKLRGKLLQMYFVENHVKFMIEAEKMAITAGPPGKVKKEDAMKMREEIELNHASTLAQLATEQDRLYQSLVHTKSIHDVLEGLLENGDLLLMDLAGSRMCSLAQEILEKESPTRQGEDVDLVKKWKNILPPDAINKTKTKNMHSSNSFPSKEVKCRLLFRTGATGAAPGKFDYPVDATFLPDGTFIVCDKNNERIQVFDKNGNYQSEFLKGDIKPRRVRLSPRDGMLYVSDELNECIKVFTLDGQLIRRIGESYFQCPAGMAIDSRGNIVMTDAEKCFVSVHRPKDGAFVAKFYYRFIGDKVIPCPYYAATNEDDHLIVSDYRNNIVKVFSNSGQVLFKITKLKCPRGVCTDPYGNIYVAEGDGNKISMYSPYGKFLQDILTEEDGLCYPLSLDMNAAGQLLVTQCGPYTPHEVLCFQVFA